MKPQEDIDDRRKIILVDPDPIGGRSQLVKAVAMAANPSIDVVVGGSKLAGPQPLTYSKALRESESCYTKPAILVTVTRSPLASFDATVMGGRRPSDEVDAGLRLLRGVGLNADVFFVLCAADCGPVDIFSLLLAGARGVLDASALGSRPILEYLASPSKWTDPLRHLLVGRPYERLAYFHGRVFAHTRLSRPQFQCLVGLAEMPELQIPAPPPSAAKIAAGRRSSSQAETSGKPRESRLRYDRPRKMTPVDVGRALEASLERRSQNRPWPPLGEWYRKHHDEIDEWLGFELESGAGYFEGEAGRPAADLQSFLGRVTCMDDSNRPLVPLFARYAGFPPQLIPVPGHSPPDLSGALYDGLKSARFSPSWSVAGDIHLANMKIGKP